MNRVRAELCKLTDSALPVNPGGADGEGAVNDSKYSGGRREINGP
jgi:hypothetical protein